MQRQEYIPIAALLLAVLLWSSSFMALKIAFTGYDPMFVIFGRMFVASLCFLVVAKRVTHRLHYQKGDWKPILFMAFCEPCLYFIFEAKAIENTTASQAGIITALLPPMVLVASFFILHESINKKTVIGAIMAVVGVCWLTLESTPTENAPNPILGNFFEFLAMVCAVGYTISLKQLTKRYSAFFLTAVQAVFGSIFFFPLIFLPGSTLPNSTPLVPTFAIIYLGAFITLGAYGLYNFGVQHVPATRATMFINLIPVFAVLLGWIFLNERLSPSQMAAATLICISVTLTQTKSPKKTRLSND